MSTAVVICLLAVSFALHSFAFILIRDLWKGTVVGAKLHRLAHSALENQNATATGLANRLLALEAVLGPPPSGNLDLPN